MINNPPPFKGLNIRIPIIIPIKGRGFIRIQIVIPIKGRGFMNQGSGLAGSCFWLFLHPSAGFSS